MPLLMTTQRKELVALVGSEGEMTASNAADKSMRQRQDLHINTLSEVSSWSRTKTMYGSREGKMRGVNN